MSEAPKDPGQIPAVTPPVVTPPVAPGAPAAASKPEFLADQFWDADKGAIKLEDFGKHYGELSAGPKAEAERLAAYPQKIEELKFTLPEDLKGPDGKPLTLDEQNPAFQDFRKVVFDKKIDPALASEFVGLYAKAELAKATRLTARLDEEKKALGPNVAARIDTIDKFLGARVGAEGAKAITDSLFTAKAIGAFEGLMKSFSNQGAAIPNGGAHEIVEPPRPPLEDRLFPNRKDA